MNKTVYIQTRPDGQILNQGCYTAYYGFTKLGYKIVFYDSVSNFINKTSFYTGKTGLDNKQIEYPDVVVGGIDTLRAIMDNLNIPQPKIIQPHVALPGFIHRKMFVSTLSSVRENSIFASSAKPFFIKPLEGDKTFTGFVCKAPMMDLIKLRNLPDDFPVLISDVVEFQAEFRVFIQGGKIIDCKNYTGNFWLRPNPQIVQEAIDAFENPPAAYTLDWGIDMNGNTILIEINDAFGLAPYGLDPVKYAKLLETRWNELTLQRIEK